MSGGVSSSAASLFLLLALLPGFLVGGAGVSSTTSSAASTSAASSAGVGRGLPPLLEPEEGLGEAVVGRGERRDDITANGTTQHTTHKTHVQG